jgi:2-dehydropantoate 2-reductase
MSPPQPLKIGIVGAGAIGSALAAQLALTGQSVALVARGPRRDELIKHGIRLCNDSGDPRVARPAIIDPEGLGALDLVITAVKAQALPELLPQLARTMSSSALLMPAVNGLPWWYFQGNGRFGGTTLASLDPRGDMLPLFTPERLIGCVVYTRAAMKDDGAIVVRGQQSLRIGRIDMGEMPAAIGHQLASAGISISIEDNIRREVWRKLLRNASTNLVSGLTGTTLEQIVKDTGLLDIVERIAHEVIALAARFDCPLEAEFDRFVDELHRAGPHPTSTLQDIRAGREPELDALAGAPLQAARLVQHDMPTLRHVLGLLRAQLRYAPAR